MPALMQAENSVFAAMDLKSCLYHQVPTLVQKTVNKAYWETNKKKKKCDPFYLGIQGQKLLIWSYQDIGSNEVTT